MKDMILVQVDGGDTLFITETIDNIDNKIKKYYLDYHEDKVEVNHVINQTVTYGDLDIWEVEDRTGYIEKIIIELLPLK